MAHPPASPALAVESTDRRAAQGGEVHIGTGLLHLHSSGRESFRFIQSYIEMTVRQLREYAGSSNLVRLDTIQVHGRDGELVTLLRDGLGTVGVDEYAGSSNLARLDAIQVHGRDGELVPLLRDGLGTVGMDMDEYAGSGNLVGLPGDHRAPALYDGSGNHAGLTLLPAAGRDEGAGAVYVDIGRLERHVRPGFVRGEGPAGDVVQRHPVAVRAEAVLTALHDVSRSVGAAGESFRGLADEIRTVFHSFTTAVGHVRGLLVDAVWIIMALSTAVRALAAGAGSPAFVFLLLIVGVVLVIQRVRRA